MLSFSLHIPLFELENYNAKYYTQARSKKKYPDYEPFPVRTILPPF
jgi:hypothetical protein